MHGSGVIRYINGDAYIGSFNEDKKHGTGNLFKVNEQMKQKEDWTRGVRKNFVKTPANMDEFNA